jgi:ABC-type polysaccharide/polyol phosphate transport system ATPase subunit
MIEVRGLDKTFRIPNQRVETLKERATQLFRATGHRELHALRGIDFDVYRGEFFGIVGRNGSGKSTLLKLLASIYRADAGSIRIGGRVAPCIELGVGFNPELTARENVALNGVMMGLSPREARARFAEIIEFAELEDFTGLKLKNYSSGMLVRLGFSLMTHVDADLLLIDEVLAVGDASFQRKCFDAFSRLHSEGRTIVLVTHDMDAVERNCDRAILLENGVLEHAGDPDEVARRYLTLNFHRLGAGDTSAEAEGPRAKVDVVEATLRRESGEQANSFEQGEPMLLDICFEAKQPLRQPVFNFQIVHSEGVIVYAPEPMRLGRSLRPGERVRIRARVAHSLSKSHFYVHASVALDLGSGRNDPILFRHGVTDFVVYGTERWSGLVEIETNAELIAESEDGA